MYENIQLYLGGLWITYPIIRSLQGNETFDETLDKMTVSFFGASDSIAHGTKARVLFENVSPTYNSDGRPLNHLEMIVDSEELVVSNDYNRHVVRLVEPTAILKEIRMESLTFTSRDSITIREWNGSAFEDAVYTKTPYNLLSTIQRIFKTTRYKTSEEDLSLTNRIQIIQAQLLQNTGINIDDQFKENSVYDALFKIGKYFGNQGRVPVLVFSKTNPYEYDLWFDRQDGIELPILDYSTFVANSKAIVKSTSPSQTADAVVSDATNMVSYNKAQGVAQYWYGFPNYDETITAPSSSDKAFLLLKHRISDVIRLRRLNANYDTTSGYNIVFRTIPCVSFDEWNISGDKNNMAYYKDGEDKIYFGSTLNTNIYNANRENAVGSGVGAWLMYNVQYYPLIDTKITKSKSSSIVYETTFNQVDSFVDSGTYGSMLEQYIKTHGNAELTVVKSVGSYENIAKLGQRVVSGATTYHITSITYKTHQNEFEVVYQLNQNAVKRNDYVGASQRIRNGGIDYDNTQIRYSTIREQLGIRLLTSLPSASATSKYIKGKKSLLYGLFTTVQKEIYRDEIPQVAYIQAASSIVRNGISGSYAEWLKMPYAATRTGNSILMNITFINNKIAGYKMTHGSSKSQSPVYYANPFAEVDSIKIGFGKWKSITGGVYLTADNSLFNIPTASFNDLVDYAKTAPSSDFTEFINAFDTGCFIKIDNYEWVKDGREVGNISYQLDLVGDNCTINPELLDYCGLLQRDTSFTQLYVIVLVAGKQLGESDIILTGDIATVISAGDPIVTNRANYIQFTTVSSVTCDGRTFAIAKQVSAGVYKPLVFANNRNFYGITNFYIAY